MGLAPFVEVDDLPSGVVAEVHGAIDQRRLLRQLVPGRGGHEDYADDRSALAVLGPLLGDGRHPAVGQEEEAAHVAAVDVGLDPGEQPLALDYGLVLVSAGHAFPAINRIIDPVVAEVVPAAGIEVVDAAGQDVGLAPVLFLQVDGEQLVGAGLGGLVILPFLHPHGTVAQNEHFAPQVRPLHGEQQVHLGVQDVDLIFRDGVEIAGAVKGTAIDVRVILQHVRQSLLEVGDVDALQFVPLGVQVAADNALLRLVVVGLGGSKHINGDVRIRRGLFRLLDVFRLIVLCPGILLLSRLRLNLHLARIDYRRAGRSHRKDIVHRGVLHVAPDIGILPHPEGAVSNGSDVLNIGAAVLSLRNGGGFVIGQCLRGTVFQRNTVDVIDGFVIGVAFPGFGVLPLQLVFLLADQIEVLPIRAAPAPHIVHVNIQVQIFGHIDRSGQLLGIVLFPAARQQAQQQAYGQQQCCVSLSGSIHNDSSSSSIYVIQLLILPMTASLGIDAIRGQIVPPRKDYFTDGCIILASF